ncbi:MAG: tyrosine-type recombinase/integrase [Thermoplasmatota archaeon]
MGDLIDSKLVNDWILDKQSEKTRPRYRYHINQFFRFINKTPEEYINEEFFYLETQKRNKLIHQYRKNLKNFKNHLMNVPNKKGTKNLPPTIRTILSTVRSFFEFHEIELGIQFWKKLNRFSNTRISIKDSLTHEILKDILNNCPLQAQCYFMICATTGSRIGMVLQLKRKDIDINREFPTIEFNQYDTIKNKKTKIKFTTPEVRQKLQSYFNKHKFNENDYIFSALRTKKNIPMTPANAGTIFRTAYKNTKHYAKNDNTGINKITTQNLKSFTKSYFKCSDEKFKDYICEHSNDLDKRYWNLPLKELEKLYKEGYKNLLIYEKPYDTDEVKQLREEQRRNKGIIKVLSERSEQLEKQQKEYTKILNKHQEIISSLRIIKKYGNTYQYDNELGFYFPLRLKENETEHFLNKNFERIEHHDIKELKKDKK